MQDFDPWCLIRGINPIEITAYRLVNLVKFYLLDGLDKEGQDKMNGAIQKIAENYVNPWLTLMFGVEKKKEVVQVRDSRGKWIPPENWKPVGWQDDSVAYQNAKAAVSGIKEVKYG